MKNFAVFLHKVLYPLLKCIFGAVRKHKFVFMNKPSDLPTNAIYAVNHSCKYDIPYACEIINKASYVLVGKQSLNLIDRMFFALNGTVWVDRKDRTSRKRAMDKMVDLLNRNANVLIFPEGTWNLKASLPMLPLYWGVIDIARATDKPIIPVVLEYYENECVVAFGKNMTVDKLDSKRDKIRELRDLMSALKWEIWEKFPYFGYESEEKWRLEAEQRVRSYPRLDTDYERSIIRKEFEDEETVYNPIAALEIKSKTAFLIKKIIEIRNRQKYSE